MLVMLFAGPSAKVLFASDDEAGDPTELLSVLKDALREDDTTAATRTIKRLVSLYAELTGEARNERRKIVDGIGKAVKHDETRIVEAALDGLADMGDERATRYFKRFLRIRSDDELPEHYGYALRCIERLAEAGGADKLVKTMLDVATDRGNMRAQTMMIRALGAFGRSEERVDILEELVDHIRKLRPGVKNWGESTIPPGQHTGRGAISRFETLGQAVVEAANRLTGMNVQSPIGWIDMLKTYKRRPDDLFEHELE